MTNIKTREKTHEVRATGVFIGTVSLSKDFLQLQPKIPCTLYYIHKLSLGQD